MRNKKDKKSQETFAYVCEDVSRSNALNYNGWSA